jgi:hypothetical protein
MQQKLITNLVKRKTAPQSIFVKGYILYDYKTWREVVITTHENPRIECSVYF